MKMIEGLDDCLEDLFKHYEKDGITANSKKAKAILEEYLAYTNENFTFIGNSLPINKVLALKNEYIYTSEDYQFFFELLEKYHYDMTNEIRDVIRTLGNLENPNKNREIIEKFLHSPIIQDITYNGKERYVIDSEEYGKFEFLLAKEYFKKNHVLTYYMQHNEMLQRCHTHTKYIASILPELYSITSLCNCYFDEKFYHSYSYHRETNQVIDLCIGAIIDYHSYYQLYHPQELSVILNKKVEEEYAIVNQIKTTTTSKYKLNELMKIALYKQYLQHIGYQGELKDAPVISKIKK